MGACLSTAVEIRKAPHMCGALIFMSYYVYILQSEKDGTFNFFSLKKTLFNIFKVVINFYLNHQYENSYK